MGLKLELDDCAYLVNQGGWIVNDQTSLGFSGLSDDSRLKGTVISQTGGDSDNNLFLIFNVST